MAKKKEQKPEHSKSTSKPSEGKKVVINEAINELQGGYKSE
jgi:hypothetical protein